MKSFKLLSVLSLSLFVTACGTMISGHSQQVTLRTPGAGEAKCTMDNGVNYVARTDETIVMTRSQKDLHVDCYASGNRHKQVVVEAGLNGWTAANVTNGLIPGVAFDHLGKGMYQYPDVITVDFTGMPNQGFDLPDYHNKDGLNPYDQAIESYNASSAKTPLDAQYSPTGITKRPPMLNNNPFQPVATMGSGASSVSVSPLPATSGPQPIVPRGSTTEELNRSMNPHAFKN